MNNDSPPNQENPRPKTYEFARTLGVGLVMGAADIVPGVSGGTVALILGIYQRLLTAISNINGALLRRLFRGEFRQVWRQADAGFLLALGFGIGMGVKGLASLMTYLLMEQREFTLAAFFGLILASGLLVSRMARPKTPTKGAQCVAFALIAASFAVWLMSQGRITPASSYLYTTACGAIAICAMILPGISGAYLLLILGKYEEISGMVHRAPALSGEEFATLGVFALGCLFGLLAFSRLLKWLLQRYWSTTMSVLAGFMIGSLYRVWPFQKDTTPEVEELKLKSFEPMMPTTIDGSVIGCLAIAMLCFLMVLLIDVVAARLGTNAESAGEDISQQKLG